MKNMVVLLTIVSALSSQILPQILFLSIMAVEEGVGRLIPFLIFYVASMSGLLLWVYVIGRRGKKRYLFNRFGRTCRRPRLFRSPL